MMNGIPNPMGQELNRVAKQGQRGGVDSIGRVLKDSERLQESDVEMPLVKKPKTVRDGEKNDKRG